VLEDRKTVVDVLNGRRVGIGENHSEDSTHLEGGRLSCRCL
jgi:hypothetical protein